MTVCSLVPLVLVQSSETSVTAKSTSKAAICSLRMSRCFMRNSWASIGSCVYVCVCVCVCGGGGCMLCVCVCVCMHVGEVREREHDTVLIHLPSEHKTISKWQTTSKNTNVPFRKLHLQPTSWQCAVLTFLFLIASLANCRLLTHSANAS